MQKPEQWWRAVRRPALDGWLILGVVLAGLMVAPAAGATTIETTLEPFTGGPASVLLTITDDAVGLERGEILVRVRVLDGGPLRGVFLDLADASVLRRLRVIGDDVTDVEKGEVIDLGQGSNVHGGGTPCPCDLGVEIGSPGRPRGSLLETSFRLSTREGPLDISLFFDQRVGVRLSPQSSKLKGLLPIPEPSTLLLLTAGLLGLALARRG